MAEEGTAHDLEGGAESGWEERLKPLGVVGLAAYIAGLIIVNAYLSSFGSSDFAVLQPRSIATAALALAVVVAPMAALIWTVRWSLAHVPRTTIRNTGTDQGAATAHQTAQRARPGPVRGRVVATLTIALGVVAWLVIRFTYRRLHRLGTAATGTATTGTATTGTGTATATVLSPIIAVPKLPIMGLIRSMRGGWVHRHQPLLLAIAIFLLCPYLFAPPLPWLPKQAPIVALFLGIVFGLMATISTLLSPGTTAALRIKEVAQAAHRSVPVAVYIGGGVFIYGLLCLLRLSALQDLEGTIGLRLFLDAGLVFVPMFGSAFSALLLFDDLKRAHFSLGSLTQTLTKEQQAGREWTLVVMAIGITFAYCVTFGLYIYPAIPQALGGGRPEEARLIFTGAGGNAARAANIPVCGSGGVASPVLALGTAEPLVSKPVKILYEGADSYLLDVFLEATATAPGTRTATPAPTATALGIRPRPAPTVTATLPGTHAVVSFDKTGVAGIILPARDPGTGAEGPKTGERC